MLGWGITGRASAEHGSALPLLLRLSCLALALLADVGEFVLGDFIAGLQRQRVFVGFLGCVQIAQFNQG
ncbi:MAG: hypothetical protein DI584_16985 [Stenotrophomonas sp.]|nr:MAG: hypothetical protein DI584_16985 [Stenotrophomonas sp.]